MKETNDITEKNISEEEKGANGESNSKKRSKSMLVLDVALIVMVTLAVCTLIVKIFFITSVTVNQTSMFPTYNDGERVYVNRVGAVERGKVVVFFDGEVSNPKISSAFPVFAGDSLLLIKRTVALEGDQIWLEEIDGGYGLVIRCADSGEIIREEYVGRSGEGVELAPETRTTAGVLWGATRFAPYVVGEGCAFLMGDNREGSMDSRYFGDVPLSRIVGVAMN